MNPEQTYKKIKLIGMVLEIYDGTTMHAYSSEYYKWNIQDYEIEIRNKNGIVVEDWVKYVSAKVEYTHEITDEIQPDSISKEVHMQ
ncbi:MAG: hypothetical protein JRN26_05525 [Nitrososphaerota archaeon]|jgi:hypothetical protein|nr:hypothetical protein [Nitrososphaerota archaeon]MDG6927185.1 hypothetical protein [Nitrososphaerota archaeon]MDG6930827.1 hypothetical protein [Nitrososphaerota archaeon]MDG6932271.1 hypothetical protein [Nitrososphaerota archaeon]MDG6936324.1 hypothetical protein [Nitrososphaerota archaeon]